MKITLSVILGSVLLSSFGCDRKPAGPSSWPPRTHSRDSEAAAVASSATLVLEIDPCDPIQWSGKQESNGGHFMPVQGEFIVGGGVLVSRLGSTVKRAKFTEWSPIYKSDVADVPIGWGPCLTEGEILLPNIFLQDGRAGCQVANRFEAEDFGDSYTLVHLRPDQKHSVCIWFREPRRGQRFFGRLGQEGTARLRGLFESCELQTDYRLYRLDQGLAGVQMVGSQAEDPMLTMTTGFVGTEVTMGKWTFARKADGWYLGVDKVSK